MKLSSIATTVAVVFSTNAVAQSTTPASAPVAVATPALTKHNCIKPELIDGTQKNTQARMNEFVAAVNTYKTCVGEFAQDQKKLAEQQQQVAQATIASANAAIKEYNEFVEESNKVTSEKVDTQQRRDNDNATKSTTGSYQPYKATPAPK